MLNSIDNRPSNNYFIWTAIRPLYFLSSKKGLAESSVAVRPWVIKNHLKNLKLEYHMNVRNVMMEYLKR